MSCANNVLPVYMWPSPGKIPEALCLPPVQVDTVHFSSEATETNGFSRLSSSLNRTAVIRFPKQRRLPQTLSHAEARRILAAVRNPIHRGCFSLIYGCGLRISEAATLPVTAIDKTSGVLRVVGKGNKERLVPVPNEVHDGLRRMWQANDHRDPRWLFPNRWRTGPVTTHVLTRTF